MAHRDDDNGFTSLDFDEARANEPLSTSNRKSRFSKLYQNKAFIIIAIVLLDAICFGGFRFARNRNSTLKSIFLTICFNLTFGIASLWLYRRITSISLRRLPEFWKDIARKCLPVFALTLIILTHIAYFFHFVALPDDFAIPVICFLAFAVWAHCVVFLLLLYLVECFSRLSICLISRWLPSTFDSAIPLLKHPIFTSKTGHTIFAIVLAFGFTIQGFTVTSMKPIVRDVNIRIPNLPSSFNGFSIAMISDIHTGPTVGKAKITEMVNIVNNLQPDLIAVVGDLVDGYVDKIGNRIEPMKDLHAPYGVLGTVGNHEYIFENIDHWIEFFKNELKINMLINEGVVIEKGGKKLCVAGLDDFVADTSNIPGHKMDIEKALGYCPANTSTIVLAHQPNGATKVLETIPRIGKPVDLILSGHTHAGQLFITYPITKMANHYFFGYYYYPPTKTQLYVSSGVNYAGPPLKMFRSICEIVYIKLYRAESNE